MELNHTTEFGHGTGGILHIPDPRDYKYGDHIGGGTSPFDWNGGYDIESELGFKIPSKDQNGSFSCGGQAWSYLGGALKAINNKQPYDEDSAKFIYSHTFVGGGGSDGRVNSQYVLKNGWGLESDTPSYENGQPANESFYERPQDVTPQAFSNAKKELALGYATVSTDIDSIAQGVRDNHGIILGVSGANNGTWNSAFPLPPTDPNNVWHHWLYAGKAKMINGNKYIGVKNSWGDDIGDHGWQWLPESYFNEIYVWVGWVVILNSHSDTPSLFSRTLVFGMKGDDVKELQTLLKITSDGIFGKDTLSHVKLFQTLNNLVPDGIVGKKTQAVLATIET